MSYSPKTYRKQGGDEFIVAPGGAINVEAGGALKLAGVAVSAAAAELNIANGMPATITFTPAAGGANVSEVTCRVRDAAGDAIAGVFHFDLWLSDAASGAGLTGTSASGTVTNKSASGYILSTITSKKALRVQTLATGIFILEITDTAKTGFRVCAQVPSTGATAVSAALVAGNYG
jgi:hypothetical protein